MCDEREPLLAYLYDETDPAERQRVEAHLATCETCRDELNGLRHVREDLLAWDVPDHGSVWKPFTSARPSWSWRDVPAWTLAAAAAIVFAIGAGSSVAANAWLTNTAPVRSASVVVPAPLATAVAAPAAAAAAAVTKEELAAFETHLLKELQDAKASATVSAGLTSSEYDRLLAIALEQHTTLLSSNKEIGRLTQRVNNLETQLAQAQQPGGQQGGR